MMIMKYDFIDEQDFCQKMLLQASISSLVLSGTRYNHNSKKLGKNASVLNTIIIMLQLTLAREATPAHYK